MTRISPIQQLDLVLQFIANDEFSQGISRTDILSKINAGNEIKIGKSDLTKVLDKLVKDNYISREHRKHREDIFGFHDNKDPIFYSIQWEGYVFISEGGYQGKRTENEKFISLEAQQRSINRWMLVLTGVLAAGTAIQAYCAIVTICK